MHTRGGAAPVHGQQQGPQRGEEGLLDAGQAAVFGGGRVQAFKSQEGQREQPVCREQSRYSGTVGTAGTSSPAGSPWRPLPPAANLGCPGRVPTCLLLPAAPEPALGWAEPQVASRLSRRGSAWPCLPPLQTLRPRSVQGVGALIPRGHRVICSSPRGPRRQAWEGGHKTASF